MKQKHFLISTAACFLLSIAFAANSMAAVPAAVPEPDSEADTAEILEDTKYGAIYLGWTIPEFNDLGYEFGDSVDVLLDNGFYLEDIPYYSGYYVPVGAPLLCGYPGYPHVAMAYNYGESMWEVAEAQDGMTAAVFLHEKGKYLPTQELFSLTYDTEQKEEEPDEVFSNFRSVSGGNLIPELLYRSASPCNNTLNRAECTDGLIEKYGIGSALNLSDSEEEYLSFREMEYYDFPYYDTLYSRGDVIFLSLGANYMDEAFACVLSEGIYEMIHHSMPCVIHCLEGKDRTGFACSLLLSLCEASVDEIVDDYMETFKNYYGITKQEEPERYDATVQFVYSFLSFITGFADVTDATPEELKEGAENYLLFGGLDDAQILEIEEVLCGR